MKFKIKIKFINEAKQLIMFQFQDLIILFFLSLNPIQIKILRFLLLPMENNVAITFSD